MSENSKEGQSGGVNIGGSVGSVGGDIVGRDKLAGSKTAAGLEDALRLVFEKIQAAPTAVQPEAQQKLATLRHEAAKGEKANDTVVAKLVEGLVHLVPDAAEAIVSAFATPLLGAIAGPVTKYVLGKFNG